MRRDAFGVTGGRTGGRMAGWTGRKAEGWVVGRNVQGSGMRPLPVRYFISCCVPQLIL